MTGRDMLQTSTPKLDPREQHYRIAATGLILTGLFMLPFALRLSRTLAPVSVWGARIAGGEYCSRA